MNNLISVVETINKTSCPHEINLHCHTIFSDGSLSPLELFNQATKAGIKHLAITDHHTIDGYKNLLINLEHKSSSLDYPTNLWAGVEITGLLKGCLVHILALDFDINNIVIEKYLQGYSLKGDEIQANTIVSAIHNANGIAILAHPARYKIHYKDLILEANNLGFDGIEVWYNYERSNVWSPSPFICDQISNLTQRLGLLSTCVTDTHGMSILSR